MISKKSKNQNAACEQKNTSEKANCFKRQAKLFTILYHSIWKKRQNRGNNLERKRTMLKHSRQFFTSCDSNKIF